MCEQSLRLVIVNSNSGRKLQIMISEQVHLKIFLISPFVPQNGHTGQTQPTPHPPPQRGLGSEQLMWATEDTHLRCSRPRPSCRSSRTPRRTSTAPWYTARSRTGTVPYRNSAGLRTTENKIRQVLWHIEEDEWVPFNRITKILMLIEISTRSER